MAKPQIQQVTYDPANRQIFGVKPPINDYTVFPEEYFTGCDTSIYIGGLKVEATRLSFNLRENVMPIYSYGSFEPKVWARGSRLVEGSISIAFRESFYIYGIMSQMLGGANAPPSTNKSLDTKLQEMIKAEIKKNPGKNPEEIVKALKDNYGRKEFEVLATAYEDAIWGGPARFSTVGAGGGFSNKVAPSEAAFINEYVKSNTNRGIYKPHWDYIQESVPVSIYIAYGQVLQDRKWANQSLYKSMNDKVSKANTTIIDLKAGIKRLGADLERAIKKKNVPGANDIIQKIADKQAHLQKLEKQVDSTNSQLNTSLPAYKDIEQRYGEAFPNTTHVIRNVHFTSVAQDIVDNAPVEERYDFMASGLDEID